MGIIYNRNIFRALFLSNLFLGLVLVSNAQNITKEEVTVIAPYSPRIAKAKKIISFPESELNTITKFKLDYYTNPKLISTTFELEELKAAKYISPKDPNFKQNNISVGLGLYATPYAEVFLNDKWNNKLTIGLHAKYLSSKATVEDFCYSGFNNSSIEIWGKRTLSKNVSWFSGFYNRDVMHYYGFRTHNYIREADVLPDFAAISAQTFSATGLKFNFYNIPNSGKESIKFIGIYRHFWDKYGNNENLISLDGSYQRPIDFLGLKNQFVGLGLNTEIAITNWIKPTQEGSGDPTSLVDLFKGRQNYFHGKTDLKLLYNIIYDRFDLKIGAMVSAGLDSTSTLKIYPDLSLNVNIVKNILDFYMTVDGGLISPTYYSLTRENPFVSAFLPLNYSSRTYRLNGGLKANIEGLADIHLWGSNESLQNAVFFTTDTSRLYNNQFKLIYDSVELFQIGNNIRFSLGEAVFDFELIYQKYIMTNEDQAWYKPTWQLKVSTNYWLYDNLLLNMTIKGQSSVPAKEGKYQRVIGTWFDVSMGAKYHFDKDFSAFIKLNNVLSKNYQIWYNYPVKGFGAMLGVSYAF